MRDDRPPAAELRAVAKARGGRPVLAGLSLAIRPGEVTALLGPNGAGKTTLVELMTGQLAPDGGEARLFGLNPRERAARMRMGVMPQTGGVPEALTVREAVALQAGYFPHARPVDETLSLAGLTELAGRRCEALSGGQKRRVQFALAIAADADLIVLDEPSVGLDPEARRAMWAVVRARAEAGAAVLLTTHHLDEADALADRIVVLAGGRIVADDRPAGIKARVAGSTIRCRTLLTVDALTRLPSARRATREGVEATLLSADAPATLRALLAADPALSDLTVTAASLDEAIAELTTTTLKEAA